MVAILSNIVKRDVILQQLIYVPKCSSANIFSTTDKILADF
jgi:hypothetical protein